MILSICYIIITTISLVFIFLIYKDKKYVMLSPLFMLNITITITFIGYLTFHDFLSSKTLLTIFIFYLLFNLSYIISDRRNIRISHNDININIQIKYYFKILLLILQVLSVVAVSFYMYSVIQTNGLVAAFSFEALNYSDLRRYSATTEINVPIYIKILNQLNIFNFINPIILSILYIKEKTKFNFLMLTLSMIFGFLYSLILLQKAYFFTILIIFIYIFLYMNSNLKKTFFKLILPLVLCFFIIGGIINEIRKDNSLDTNNNTPMFARHLAGLVGLDAFIAGTSSHVNILEDQKIYLNKNGFEFNDIELGQNTFYFIFRLVDMIDGTADIMVAKHGEYIYLPMMTNVYTFLRPIYQDFHIFGIIVAALAIGYVFQRVYSKSYNSKSLYKYFFIGYLNYIMIRFTDGNTIDLRFILSVILILYILKKVKIVRVI